MVLIVTFRSLLCGDPGCISLVMVAFVALAFARTCMSLFGVEGLFLDPFFCGDPVCTLSLDVMFVFFLCTSGVFTCVEVMVLGAVGSVLLSMLCGGPGCVLLIERVTVPFLVVGEYKSAALIQDLCLAQ